MDGYVTMGLAKASTKTFGLGIGVTVWDSVSAAAIITATGVAIARRSKYWVQANPLYIGMVLLSV